MAEPISDVLLERYLASDVSRAQKKRIEAALADPSVAARLAALQKEREQFYASRQASTVARAIESRAAAHGERCSSWLAWLGPALATAAGVVFVFQLWHNTLPPPTESAPPDNVAPVENPFVLAAGRRRDRRRLLRQHRGRRATRDGGGTTARKFAAAPSANVGSARLPAHARANKSEFAEGRRGR